MERCIIVFVILFSIILSVACFASDTTEALIDALPESLEKYEIDENFLKDGLSHNFIFESVLNIISTEFKNCTKLFLKMLSIIILFSVFNGFGNNKSYNSYLMSGVVYVSLLTICFPTINSNMELINQTLKSSEVFATASIPVITAVSVSSGKAFGATVFSAALSLCCTAFQYVADYVLFPVTVILLVLGLVSGFVKDFDVYSVCTMLKKLIKWIITCFVGIFTTSLSFQNILSNSSDGVIKKTIQNAVGKFIPIVGSVLSGAIDEMFALASLSKVTVSIFGVLIILLLFLPLIIGNLLYGGVICLCKSVLRFFNAVELNGVMSAISDTFFLYSGICSACAFMLSASYLLLSIGNS